MRRPGYKIVAFYTKRKKVRPITLRVKPARIPRPYSKPRYRFNDLGIRTPKEVAVIKVSDQDKERLVAHKITKGESFDKAVRDVDRELGEGKIDIGAARLEHKQAQEINRAARLKKKAAWYSPAQEAERYREQEARKALERGAILVTPEMERTLARELKDHPATELDSKKQYVTRTSMGHLEVHEVKRDKNGKVELDYRGKPERDYDKQIPTIRAIEDISFNGKLYDARTIHDILRRGVNKHRALTVSKNKEGDLVMRYSDGTVYEPRSREPGSWEKTRVSLEGLLKRAAA